MKMKSVGRKNVDMMEKLMKMKMKMRMRRKKRKKAGKVRRGREKQMMKEKMIKTPNNLQKENCPVLVGRLTWIW